MSCMVAAPRAHKATITTVEGLAQNDHLHPIQQGFIEKARCSAATVLQGFSWQAQNSLRNGDSLLMRKSSRALQAICAGVQGTMRLSVRLSELQS